MTAVTHTTITQTAKAIFARRGYDGLAMRGLAEESNVGLSSIYHFFKDKDVLLKHIFNTTNTQLGLQRAKLPKRKTAEAMLKDRVLFQFRHIEDIVFVLKYYLQFRADFAHLHRGYVPDKAYLHIEEVLRTGILTGELKLELEDIASESKIITHAINGFLLEYYPEAPKGKELTEVVNGLHSFIWRAVKCEPTERRSMTKAN